MLTPSPGLEIVPGYRLVRRLGKGMQGEVWSADGSGGFQAAIKIVHNMEERATKRELWALASLRHVKHPNLCPLFGFWLLDGNGKVLPISIADFERTPEDSIPVGTMQLPSNAAIPGAAIPGTSDSGGVVRSGSGKSSESRRGGGSAGRGGLSDSDDFEVVDDDEVRSTTMEPTDSGSRRSGGPHGFDASRPTPGPDQDATVTAVLSPDQQNAPLGDPNAATHVALDRTSRFAEDETARVRGDTFEKISASQALDQAESLVIAMGLGDQTLGDYLKSLQKTARSGVPAPAEESSVAKFSDFKNFGKQKPAPESAKQRPPAIGIPQGELIRYLSPAADAIDFLNHQHQIFHCDIKPQNLLLVGGQTQVCDFGLASRVAIDSQKTRVSFGTPAYGAPEMVFDNAYSDNIDQYSLAITYYELRTGRLPYKSKAQGTVLVAKQTGQLDFSLATPLEVAALQRATRVDPSERFDSCTEFLNALTHPAAGRTVPGTSRVVPLTTKLLTGVSLMLLIVAGWFVWSTHLGTSISGNGQREKAELENGQREKLEQNSGEQAEFRADVDRENTRAELERRAQRDAADAQRKRRAMIAGADGKLAEIETLLQTAPWPEAVPWPDPAEFESLPPAHPLVTRLPIYQTLAQWTAKTPPRKMLQWDSTRKSILDSVPDAILDAWAASVGWQIESDIAAESDWQAATEFREDALQKVVGRDRMPAPIANLLQLVRLLDIRATTGDLETNTEQILATTAAMLQPEMNPLAIAARCLVRRDRADAILDSPKIRESLRQISGDSKAATPDFAPLPETLAGVPDIGWGWLQSRTGKVAKANETWLAIVDELLQRRSLHPDDRSALAQQMVTQLIQSQGIANDDVDSLRYHSFTKDPGFLGTTKRLLTICDKLAGPAKSVKAKIWHEAYLLSVAAGDWRTADRLAGKPFQRSGQSDLADFESFLGRFGKPSANLKNAPPPLTNRWLRAAEALTRPEQPLKSKRLSRLLQPMLGILQTSASGLPEVPLFVQSDTYAVIAARLSAWLRGEATYGNGEEATYGSGGGDAIADAADWLDAIEKLSIFAARNVDEETSVSRNRLARVAIEAKIERRNRLGDFGEPEKLADLLSLYEAALNPRSEHIDGVSDASLAAGLVAMVRAQYETDPRRSRRFAAEAQRFFDSTIATLQAAEVNEERSSRLGVCMRAYSLLQLMTKDDSPTSELDNLFAQADRLSRSALEMPPAWYDDRNARLIARGDVCLNIALHLASAKQNDIANKRIQESLDRYEQARRLQIDRGESPTRPMIQWIRAMTARYALQRRESNANQAAVAQTKRELETTIDKMSKQRTRPDTPSLRVLKESDVPASTQANWHRAVSQFLIETEQYEPASAHLREVDSIAIRNASVGDLIHNSALLGIHDLALNGFADASSAERKQIVESGNNILQEIQNAVPRVARWRVFLSITHAVKARQYESFPDLMEQANGQFIEKANERQSFLVAAAALHAHHFAKEENSEDKISDALRSRIKSKLREAEASFTRAALNETSLTLAHSKLVEACLLETEQEPSQALRRLADALSIYRKAKHLGKNERMLRSLAQDWMLLPLCRRVFQSGQSVEVARQALIELRDEYGDQFPAVRTDVDRLLSRGNR